jgi:hypothetical protein
MYKDFDYIISVAQTALKSGKDIFIYGLGDVAVETFSKLTSENIKVSGFVYDNEGKKNTLDYDIPVYTSDTIKNHTSVIIIASIIYDDIIYDRLKNQGFYDSQLIKMQRQPIRYNQNIRNIMFVGDNTDTPNFGCQATSTALRGILSNSFKITDTIFRKIITGAFRKIRYFPDDLFLFINDCRLYCPDEFNDLMTRIDKTDAVVFNGEGSLIFENNPNYNARKDLMFFGIIMHICIFLNKPFYIVNTMFCPWKPENPILLEQFTKLMSFSQKVLVRDKFSLTEISAYRNINAAYCPDALFSWFSKIKVSDDDKQRFGGDYVLITGNSEAAHYQEIAETKFTSLCSGIVDTLKNINCKMVLIECCKGDIFLRKAAEILDIPIIKYDIDIKISSSIICNSKVFVTGRYHPAITASLTGVNCIFMGANSHKTTSLQDVLEIPKDEQFTYGALPSEKDIEGIVADIETLLSKPNNENIISVAEINSKKALNISTLMLKDKL